ncbi:aromatic acid exporter family protein [Oceanobacillus jeddahense]|uniref:Aromatic acid exporter family protein n=1 Tax=Oceanobacillus jeddahense TaxID=1462527 RepID=A0ABY5JNW2_9BACI|nr:aromatic acid exporter family protein [Oceanobacillus jeddahense]UUI01993.1 aromatic acid exporter family protein [Oceanobacillus jeddahense]
MKVQAIIGNRVIKTGIAVFFTALICKWLDFPPTFAVITAIVTIEPTVTDSIKKGLVRFPASAIGAAYAVIFLALFGNSPFTYMLAAVLTIFTCFRLNLHAGLLVATLTAIAMIEVVDNSYFLSFLIRLATTTIGLSVSTLVNMFVFPPNYQRSIHKQIISIRKQLSNHMKRCYYELIFTKTPLDLNLNEKVGNIYKELESVVLLSLYQKKDLKYHHILEKRDEELEHLRKQIHHLRMIQYHVTNISEQPTTKFEWSVEKQKSVFEAVCYFANVLADKVVFEEKEWKARRTQLHQVFQETLKGAQINDTEKLPIELVAIYELTSIVEIIEKHYSLKK